MRIGVPKEIKDNENRVALTPPGAATLVRDGHEVSIQWGAGQGAGFTDADYRAAGAQLVHAADCWRNDLVVKVKEPVEPEYERFAGQILFTYLHLAGVDPALTDALLASKTTAVAYETIEDERGRLPLLAPMSAVAGSMAPLIGAYYLTKLNSGRGVLLGEILGQRHGNVVIAGDGVVGQHAARVAAGIGAHVLVFGADPSRRAEIDALGPHVQYAVSEPEPLAASLEDADLFIGATLIKGARAQHLVTDAMVRRMPAGSVIVDVSIDQGGCVETSRPTTHSHPTFVVHGVIHYCVTNMPGAYPRTATVALTRATLPYIERLASDGFAALAADARFGQGVNTHAGFITYEPVATSLDRRTSYRALRTLIS
jgi:alanine dehydrogenase